MSSKIIIVTVHGIHTRLLSSWQTKFWDFVNKKDPGIKVIRYKYGFLVAPLSWLLTLTNNLRIPTPIKAHMLNSFVRFLEKLQKDFPEYQISIIGHSFGTWLSYYALERSPDLKILNLVLVQGVISCHIEELDLANWLETGKVKAVHAWSSRFDDVVCKAAIPPFGKLGCRGFIRNDHVEDSINPAEKPYNVEIYNHRTTENHNGVILNLDKYGDKLLEQLTQ